MTGYLFLQALAAFMLLVSLPPVPHVGKTDNAHAGDTASAVGVFDQIDHGLTAAQR